jgi:P-type E1-E2 ATPase
MRCWVLFRNSVRNRHWLPLKKLAAPEAQVIRDGSRKSVPAYNLVPGDIVFLEAGNFIPADLRLLEAVNLRVEEASSQANRSRSKERRHCAG